MDFTSSRTKIRRAEKHVAELREVVGTYLASKPLKVFELEPDARGNPRYRTELQNYPSEVAAILGDALHNLRSALDVMAADMARARGESSKNLYFPFGKDQADFEEAIKRVRFARTGQKAVEFAREFEPYKGGNDHLAAVHEANVVDKHINVLPDLYGGTFFAISLVDGIMRPHPKIDESLHLNFPLAPFTGKELLETLNVIVETVKVVIDAFADIDLTT